MARNDWFPPWHENPWVPREVHRKRQRAILDTYKAVSQPQQDQLAAQMGCGLGGLGGGVAGLLGGLGNSLRQPNRECYETIACEVRKHLPRGYDVIIHLIEHGGWEVSILRDRKTFVCKAVVDSLLTSYFGWRTRLLTDLAEDLGQRMAP